MGWWWFWWWGHPEQMAFQAHNDNGLSVVLHSANMQNNYDVGKSERANERDTQTLPIEKMFRCHLENHKFNQIRH